MHTAGDAKVPTKTKLQLNTLSARLKHALDIRGMKAADLCRKAGLWPTTVSKIVRGEATDPLSSTLLAMSRTLQVSPWWLFEGRGPMESADGAPPAYNPELLKKITIMTLAATRELEATPGQIAHLLRSFYEAAMVSETQEPSAAVLAALARTFLDNN